ncbi:beta-lactamase/transpeptidase-like protein [Flammula alnicola]|nr:beta-lactamase/transpeptidase-like protein [Flammula alnicola]
MTTLSPSGERALNNFIKETVEAKKIPGFVFGVSNVDGEIFFQGGGTNIVNDPASGEVNPDSVFWLCSQTKMIAALAALKLVEQGKISFDTPLSDYLPEFRNPIIVDDTSTQKTTFRPAETVLTLKHVLNFSSGLFYPVVREGPNSLPDAYTSKEIHGTQDPISSFLRVITGDLPALPLKFEPGTDFVYGFSSDVLGFIVEKVSGKTLEEFCKEHIFGPLGMESSFYLTPALKRRLVALTFRGEDGGLNPWANQLKIIEQDPEKVSVHMGGVGLYSSMRDYLKLLRHILQINAGRPVVNPILKEETVHQIFEPALTEKGAKSLSEFITLPGTQWGTALAICTQDWPQHRRKGSVFWGGWAGTTHFIDPTSGIAVVFGVQVVPYGDAEVVQFSSKLEALLYSALNTGSEGL